MIPSRSPHPDRCPDGTVFFPVRAWTTRGRLTIDLTAETPYRIPMPKQADAVLAEPR